MSENKTQPTGASVAAFLAAIPEPARRQDCKALAALMRRVTGEKAVMWGPSIVGFGQYHYRYESGREGDCCVIGFSSRKGDISVYVTDGFADRAPLLAALGPHKTGKVCLYVKRLADIDLGVLATLLRASVGETRRRHP